ncbi:hypothetical protein [Kribbella sancticallisti]|uniref:hypothetical protein n=1 Tax=Kribbella sancticallisti TaxID=460087 RepID=UPI0031D8B363
MKDIHLDTKNVRLETTSTQVEADIIEDLFVNEDAFGLVLGISQIGYLTHEVPIVVKRGTKYVVVEGNRRVAALKAIQNPMIVPEFEARVATAIKNIPDVRALSTITVKIAPNQSQADQLIAALHTSNPRRPWTPTRQAAFFQAQIDAGRTYKQLLTRYPTVDVRRFVFRGYMVNLFKGIDYREPALDDFLDSKSWRRGLSALARIFESKEFADITGIGMDDNGVLTKSISDKTFAAMATVIVRGMLDGNINTRSLNTVNTPRFSALMSELRQLAEDGVSRGLDEVAGPGGDPGGDTPQQPQKQPPKVSEPPTGGTPQPKPQVPKKPTVVKPPPKPKTKYIDLGQIQVPDSYPLALKTHYEELSQIEIQRFPNATFLMLRAILEKSIKAFADENNIDIKSSGNNTKGFVQLGHALTWLLDYVKAQGATSLIQPIEGVRSGTLVNFTASSDALNAVNHNHKFRVDPDEVLHMWNSIEPILRYVMKP